MTGKGQSGEAFDQMVFDQLGAAAFIAGGEVVQIVAGAKAAAGAAEDEAADRGVVQPVQMGVDFLEHGDV